MVGGNRALGVLGVFVFKTPKLRVLLSKVQILAGVISITTGPAHSNRKSAVMFLVSVYSYSLCR